MGRANFGSLFATGHLRLVQRNQTTMTESMDNERFILFRSLATCCIVSIALVCFCYTDSEHSRSSPRAFQMPSIDALPSTKTNSQLNDHNQLSRFCVPSMTTFTLFIR